MDRLHRRELGIDVHVGEPAVRAPTEGLRPINAMSGHAFFNEGDHGRLHVHRCVRVLRRVVGIFDPGPRTSTAIAINDVHVAPVDGRPLLRAWIADHPEVAERLLRLAQRFGVQGRPGKRSTRRCPISPGADGSACKARAW